jgi:hypothetical protein
MQTARIRRGTIITVPDYRAHVAEWRHWKTGVEWEYIWRVVVEKPLTHAQLRRLHKDLVEKLYGRTSPYFS